MRLIIQTQDRKRLIELDVIDLRVHKDKNDTAIMFKSIILGKYKEESRAMQVLFEIKNYITLNFIEFESVNSYTSVERNYGINSELHYPKTDRTRSQVLFYDMPQE